MNFLPKIFPRTAAEQQEAIERKLIQREAEIGGRLFGPVPKGRQRQFFCLDEHTWIWYESWIENGRRKSITTRYEVRPDGVLKLQNGRYQRVAGDEARNLYGSVNLYQQRVGAEYQRMLQAA